jgi:hypothetical protein
VRKINVPRIRVNGIRGKYLCKFVNGCGKKRETIAAISDRGRRKSRGIGEISSQKLVRQRSVIASLEMPATREII